MERNVLKKAAKYSKERRRKIRLNRTLSALAAVVVFCTTYALILPAVTMEHKPICGLEEHQHDESCYAEVLACGLEEAEGHTHDSSCYTVETETVLICDNTDEDHVHDESCYETVETETLTCGLDETPAHQHSEDCYQLMQVCGKPEHIHTDACYPGNEDAGNAADAEDEMETGDEPDTEDEMDAGDELDEDEMLDETSLPVLEETYKSDWYDICITVEANSEELAGLDDLELTVTGNDDDLSGDLFYAYCALIEDDTLTPLERVDFALTSGGETIDRRLYTVNVQIIPSKDMIAYLEDMAATSMIPELAAYEIADGELVKLDRIDSADNTDSDAYAFEVEPTGNDFALFVEMTENPLDTLDTFGDPNRYANQGYWWMNVKEQVTVWWEGFEPTGSGIAYKEANVQEVYLTHFDSKTGQINQTQTQIPQGNQGHNNQTLPDGWEKPVYLQDIYYEAQPTSDPGNSDSEFDYDDAYDYIEGVSAEEATHLKVVFEFNGTKYINQMISKNNTTAWNEYLQHKGEPYWTITYCKQVIPDTPNAGHDFALLEIVPEPGYYVTQVVITCCLKQVAGYDSSVINKNYTGDAYHDCEVFNDGNAFRQSFSVADGSRVSLVVDSESFSHGNTDNAAVGGWANKADSYYIMIQTAPIPSPLYVEYDLGNEKLTKEYEKHNEWVSKSATKNENSLKPVNGNVSYEISMTGAKWVDGDLTFTTASLTDEVIAFARSQGLEFDGWELQYYTAANKSSTTITFKDRFNENSTVILNPNDTLELVTHARLVAKWVELPAVSVTKKVTGLEDGDNTKRTFTFQIDGTDKEFTVQRTVNKLVNGTYQDVEEEIKVTDGIFQMTVTGNGSQTCRIYDLDKGDYTITETVTAKATSTTYSVDGGTFAVGGTTKDVVVTNSYSDDNDTYTLNLEKVTSTSGTQGTPQEPNTDGNGNGWSWLSGAEFQITDVNGELKQTLTPENKNTGAIAKIELTYDTLYRLEETKAPAGYNVLDHVIYFTVSREDGTLKVQTVNKSNDSFEDFTDEDFTNTKYVTVNLSDDSDVLTLIIANYGGYVLPSTGGPGTSWYALGGALLMSVAAGLLVYKISQRKEDEALGG